LRAPGWRGDLLAEEARKACNTVSKANTHFEGGEGEGRRRGWDY